MILRALPPNTRVIGIAQAQDGTTEAFTGVISGDGGSIVLVDPMGVPEPAPGLAGEPADGSNDQPPIPTTPNPNTGSGGA